MPSLRNRGPLDLYVDIKKSVYQLQNDNVILEKFDSLVEKTIKAPTEINCCMFDNSSKNETLITDLTSESNDEWSDEFFSQEQEKKTALSISSPYCCKCDKTIITATKKDKNCPKCGTLLFYKCMKCNKQYTNYCSAFYHFKTVCSSGIKYHCNKCDYSTTNKYLFNKHLKAHKLTKNHKASHLLTDESNIMENQNMETSVSKLNDNDKETKGKLTDELSTRNDQNIEILNVMSLIDTSHTMHKKEISSPQHQQCTKCKNFFKNIESMNKHRQYCGKEPNYHCTHCPYKTVDRQNLLDHLRVVHKKLNTRMMDKIIEINDNNIKDANNEKSTNMSKTVILQNSENSKVIKFQCLYCNKIVNCNSTEKNCPKCDTLLLLQCKKCNKTCTTFPGLISHIRRIHDIDLLKNSSKCLRCNKEDFPTRESFVKHVKFCQKPKHLECKYCSYKTCFKSNLTSHTRRMHLTLKKTTSMKKYK